MKVLIVEDDFVSRKFIQKLLSPYAECDIAVNGKEALEAFIREKNEGTPYNLICLDLMMPEINGLDTLKQIRKIESDWGLDSHEGVKVIITTALGDKEHILKAFKQGCEAYLVKPLNPDKLLASIMELGLIQE